MNIVPEEWNEAIAHTAHAPFHQSYEWITHAENVTAFLQDFKEGSGQYSAAMVRKSLATIFFYWYIPRGPVVQNKEGLLAFFKTLQTFRERGANTIFLRCEPFGIDPRCAQESLQEIGAIETLSIQPKINLILDLSQSLDAIFGQMHAKTRYNVRVSQKSYLRIERGVAGDSDILVGEKLIDLLGETAERNAFFLHPRHYYQRLLRSFPEPEKVRYSSPFIRVYTAWKDNELSAGILVMFFGDTATYLHGASSYRHRALMAPHALHTEAFTDAKEMGYRWYDFGGVAADDDPSDHWAGITRFKKGFGGSIFETAGTYDIVFHPALFAAYEGVRGLWRKRAFLR